MSLERRRALVAKAHTALDLDRDDSDYDLIASITRQPTRWAAPRGSLPRPVGLIGALEG
jgi:hypothetical protein